MNIKINASTIARQLVYGSKPRISDDKLVTYRDMQEYVDTRISIAFGRYMHGLDNHGRFNKFTRTYKSSQGSAYIIVANPDTITPVLIEEEKCTFSDSKRKDAVGEIQLQLGGFVCEAKLGILKIKHLGNNTITREIVSINELIAKNVIERYLSQTLLPYLF